MIVTETNWEILESKFRDFCKKNNLGEKEVGELLSITITTEVNEKEKNIPDTHILTI